MERKEVIIGTRASKLALTQTYIVIEKLREFYPEIDFKIKKIKTIGDKILDKTLNKIGGKGLFVKEIEIELLKKEIDIAVHSMKDVPSKFPEGLEISAITKREDPRDVLIAKGNMFLKDLRKGARIGTSSLRRGAQIKALRSDLQVEPIRGNIQTRIKKIEELNLDGVILAAAGIKRMGEEMAKEITQYFSHGEIVPAVGQGALGIETRANDKFIKDMVMKINDVETEYCVKAERILMKELDGGCHVPIGGYAYIEEGRMKMVGMVSSIDGQRVIKVVGEDLPEKYKSLGSRIANGVIEKGGKEILSNLEGDK